MAAPEGSRCDGRSRSPRRSSAEHPWPGCHVAHHSAPWILGTEDLQSFSAGTTGAGPLPDISIDPGDRVLSVINATDGDRCFFLSLPAESRCVGSSGRRLATAGARDGEGGVHGVIAFVVVVAPQTVMDVCRLRGVRDVRAASVHSDIVDVSPPPSLQLPEGRRFVCGFPLAGPGPYLCSQGSGGRLTHFAHPSTYHAVDLDCDVGTEVLAIRDGVVREVRDSERASGVDVENFFRWNSVVVAHADGSVAEYVHVQAGSVSARVRPGERVRRGQPLCCSGDVGFCPRPHLHLELRLGKATGAASVPLEFEGAAGTFRCEEGRLYGPSGPAAAGQPAEPEECP